MYFISLVLLINCAAFCITGCNSEELAKSLKRDNFDTPLPKTPPKQEKKDEEEEPITNREGFFVAKKADGHYFVLERIEAS